jgi:hypothetical protein
MIDEMLLSGVISKPHSSWASPICQKKKQDKLVNRRSCIDYGNMKILTVEDKYPVTRISKKLDKLGVSKFSTTLDLA